MFNKVMFFHFMEEKEISQVEVAKAIGYSQSGLSLMVNGKRKMGIDVLIKIADLLEVTLEDLVIRSTPREK